MLSTQGSFQSSFNCSDFRKPWQVLSTEHTMEHQQEHAHLLAAFIQHANMIAKPRRRTCVALSHSPTAHARFPSSAVTIKYLAQGAANVVFSIHPWTPSDGKPFTFIRIEGNVLRKGESELDLEITGYPQDLVLNKVVRISKGVPKSLNCKAIIKGFEQDVKPLFQSAIIRNGTITHDENATRPLDSGLPVGDLAQGPTAPNLLLPPKPLPNDKSFEEHLMDHEGIMLTCDAFEEFLQLIPEPERHQLSIRQPNAPERAILLPNMSSVPGKSVTLEIKPKWLVQSPNAPRDAYRCRNCALRASRLAKNKDKSKETEAYLCPLELLKGHKTVIQTWVHSKVVKGVEDDALDDQLIHSITERTTEYLIAGKGRQLLAHLKRLQAHLDRTGVLGEVESQDQDEVDRRLRLAMTLRDCSLFIKIPYGHCEDDAEIMSKLGDLDFKSAEKIDDWAQKEISLANGQWYTSTKQVEGLNCLISQGWKRDVPYYW